MKPSRSSSKRTKTTQMTLDEDGAASRDALLARDIPHVENVCRTT